MGMDANSLLRGQLRHAHEQLEETIDGVTREQASRLPPGKGHSIGSMYARAVILEDAIINALLKGDRPLFSTTWDNRVGVDDCMPLPAGLWADFSGPGWEEYDHWARSVRLGLLGLRRYAQAVYAASDDYLSSLTPGDLERAFDVPGLGIGRMPMALVVSRLVVGQIDAVRGEIVSAARLLDP
jgi:hypothetical protein